MRSIILLGAALLCGAIAVCSAAVPAADADVQNRNVDRTIDLTAQNVKISHKITLVHKTKQPIETYNFVLPAPQRDALAHISFRDAAKKELKYVESTLAEATTFVVALQAPAAAGATQVLYVDAVLTRQVSAFPTHIAQNEKQLVRYYGSAYFYSPYVTIAQKTAVLLSSKMVESYTPVKPSSLNEATVTYGPYENVPALSKADIVVHYENFTPFLTVTRLERVIEVSHWGNIAVEETIDILHTGALLKGPFSRYDFQKDGRSGLASVKQYKTLLPASASGVYYR